MLEARGVDELGLLNSLTAAIVEQDSIAVGLPNRREAYRSGTMKTEKDPAGLFGPHENAFGHLERVKLELIVVTKGFVDIIAQVFQGFNLLKAGQHWGRGLLIWHEDEEDTSSVTVGQYGWSADKNCYRLFEAITSTLFAIFCRRSRSTKKIPGRYPKRRKNMTHAIVSERLCKEKKTNAVTRDIAARKLSPARPFVTNGRLLFGLGVAGVLGKRLGDLALLFIAHVQHHTIP